MRTRSIGRDFSKLPTIIPRRGNQLYDREVYPAVALPPGEKATKPRQCTIVIPGLTPSVLPTRCESHVFKAGRCVTHFTDWRSAREARRIEQEQRRKVTKPNKRGRITPPIAARLTPEPKPYTKKTPKTRADFTCMVKAQAKRDRKRGRPAISEAA